MSDEVKWHEAKVPELQAGAEAGDPEAMYHLAQRYRKGREVPADMSLTVHWLLRAADLGHAHAQSSMGVRYYFGEGVPKNHRLAMKWYLAGAAKKEPEALFNVGDLFDDSDEIPKNPVETCAWMLAAAAYGYLSALDRIDPLVKGFSFENLERAARRGAQIYARCEEGKPLDPSASFQEMKPGPQSMFKDYGHEPSRLSLLIEFAHLCDKPSTDQLLMHQLIHGEAQVFVRGVKSIDAGSAPTDGECLYPLDDGNLAVMAYTDYAKFFAHQGDRLCHPVASSTLVDLMERLKANTIIVNPGTPACYSMSRRPPTP